MVMYNLLLVLMLRHPTIVMLETVHEIFPAPPIHLKVEELGVRVPLLDIPDARTLLF